MSLWCARRFPAKFLSHWRAAWPSVQGVGSSVLIVRVLSLHANSQTFDELDGWTPLPALPASISTFCSFLVFPPKTRPLKFHFHMITVHPVVVGNRHVKSTPYLTWPSRCCISRQKQSGVRIRQASRQNHHEDEHACWTKEALRERSLCVQYYDRGIVEPRCSSVTKLWLTLHCDLNLPRATIKLRCDSASVSAYRPISSRGR